MSDIRTYLLFQNDEALHVAMADCLLTPQEQATLTGCVRNCIFDGNMRRTLVLQRPAKDVPKRYQQMAREVFVQWPKEDRIDEIKNSTGTDATEGIRNFGRELFAYEGRLHNFG